MSELPESVGTTEDFITDVMEPQEVGHGHPGWHKHVALTILVLALLTALGAILAGMSSHQAMIQRTQEIIEVNSLEGDRVYVETLKSKHEILTILGGTPDKAEITTIAAIEEEMLELEIKTVGDESLVKTTTKDHNIFAIAVALLSLGTALCSMSIIVNQKYLWVVGLLFGAIGIAGVCLGILGMLS